MTSEPEQMQISPKILPFIKWAGGKRWLADTIQELAPAKIENYHEPFFGGGAVFFSLQPKAAMLSDTNADLISCYKYVRKAPRKIEALLAVYQERHSVDFYYEVRASKFSDPIQRAAQFLYLNRTCFNGLYRVNKLGQFNVPVGTKTSVVLPSDDFRAAAKVLKGVKLICCDFEVSIDSANEGDFVFCDPPYTVKHNMNGFIKYNEKIFSWSDQIRLRDCVARAKNRGVKVVVTNAKHDSVKDLYSKISEEITVERSSVMSGQAVARGRYEESVFVC